jgi:hypothetical protein
VELSPHSRLRKNRIRHRRAGTAKSAVHTALVDPMLVATGIQVIRAIGIKRLIPLAVGGRALGLLVNRDHHVRGEAPAE